MKSLLLSIALLSAVPIVASDVTPTVTCADDDCPIDKSAMSVEDPDQQAEDMFDMLMDTEVPTDMIKEPKPVTPCEACLKQIGVQVFMKYIACKIWLEHQWKYLMGNA